MRSVLRRVGACRAWESTKRWTEIREGRSQRATRCERKVGGRAARALTRAGHSRHADFSLPNAELADCSDAAGVGTVLKWHDAAAISRPRRAQPKKHREAEVAHPARRCRHSIARPRRRPM